MEPHFRILEKNKGYAQVILEDFYSSKLYLEFMKFLRGY